MINNVQVVANSTQCLIYQFSFKVISFWTPLLKSGVHYSNLLKFTYNNDQFHYYNNPKMVWFHSVWCVLHIHKNILIFVHFFLKNPCPPAIFNTFPLFLHGNAFLKFQSSLNHCQPSLLIVNNSLFLENFIFCCCFISLY